ncbi:MAG: hypothetical protein D8M22_09390 [Armatimonadetes bacterium]|nr:hypothetical protein [Armatimonadota bacterium]
MRSSKETAVKSSCCSRSRPCIIYGRKGKEFFSRLLGVGPGHRFSKLRVATLQAAFILGAGFHQGVALRSNLSARWACRTTDVHLTKEFGAVP